jgi:hypothetical protein
MEVEERLPGRISSLQEGEYPAVAQPQLALDAGVRLPLLLLNAYFHVCILQNRAHPY